MCVADRAAVIKSQQLFSFRPISPTDVLPARSIRLPRELDGRVELTTCAPANRIRTICDRCHAYIASRCRPTCQLQVAQLLIWPFDLDCMARRRNRFAPWTRR